MTMDLKPQPDGRLHFSLGPLEKWVAVAIGAGAIAVAGWNVRATQTLLTQQAVMGEQMKALVAQNTSIPGLRNDVAVLQVRVSNLEEKTRELERTRGAR